MNIGDLLAKAVVRFPDHTAVVFKDTRLTTSELLERVHRLGNSLLSLRQRVRRFMPTNSN